MSEPALSAIHHVTINVRDLERSARWYTDVLGFQRLSSYASGTFERVILRHPAAAFTLGNNRHASPAGETPFDERQTAGLDHVALQAPDRAALDACVARFDEHGVTHSEVKAGALAGSFLVAFRDPDNIQLEVFSPPPP